MATANETYATAAEETAFVPSWKKAAISAALFALPVITFGLTGMVVL